MPEELRENTQVHREFSFDGAWMPDFDPSKMGEGNFAELKNYRYVEDGIEPIEGYTAITTNVINSTYKYIRDGIQLRQNIGSTTSFVIVFGWNSGETAGRIYENTTDIPDAGDFTATSIFTPTSPVKPRFAELPRGIGFCSETETCIYEGNRVYPGIVMLVDSVTGLSYTNPRDYTVQVTNSLQTTGNTMQLAGSALTFVLGTTRPIQGGYVDIKTANAAGGSTLSVKEWTSGAWAAVSNLSDGTSDGTDTMAQSGAITFDSTVGSSEPCFIDNVYLYHYQFTVSAVATGPVIYQITVDMPFQNAVDIWDGVFRNCISFQVEKNNGPLEDYTLEVNEESNVDYAISAKMQNFRQDAGDVWYAACEERASAMRIELIGGKGNTDAV